jgi:hypothetical protein
MSNTDKRNIADYRHSARSTDLDIFAACRQEPGEEPPLSAIFASLQIQGIYRRFTGKREIHFFGLAMSVARIERSEIR